MAAKLLASPEPRNEEPRHCPSEEALEASRATSHQEQDCIQDWIGSATALSIPASETSADWDPATLLDSQGQRRGTCPAEVVSTPSLNLPGHSLLLFPQLWHLTFRGTLRYHHHRNCPLNSCSCCLCIKSFNKILHVVFPNCEWPGTPWALQKGVQISFLCQLTLQLIKCNLERSNYGTNLVRGLPLLLTAEEVLANTYR